MNIYTSLLLYIFLLLNDLADSLILQFKFNGSNKINDKNRYWLLKVSENEGHYFFFGHARCTKVLADGILLWRVKTGDLCPGGVSYFGTDEVSINFPEDVLVFKKRNGIWENDLGLKNAKIELNQQADVVESDLDAKNKPNHPAAEEVELPSRLIKEPNYDLPLDIKRELLVDDYKQKTKPSAEQKPVPTSPETAHSGTDVSSAEPALPESE
ncbi:hypothetical protein MACJ_001589 [Theileria orientalis]|uniref:Uncharacterized protein n=1 Tax=Theileria orientalis TaxID=68886 RepID=A0A976M8W2_THEOR|nr:hypothetical protein MACJ_001589 [Theileria orientalis]